MTGSVIGLHPHGAARIAAGFGPDTSLPSVLDASIAAHIADLDEDRVHLAWELARLGPPDGDHQALLVLILLLTEAAARGSTRVQWRDPRRMAQQTVRRLDASAELAERVASLARSTHPLIGAVDERRPLIRDGDHLYTQRVHRLEVRLAERVETRMARLTNIESATAVAGELFDDVLRDPVRLTETQASAVRAALTRPLSIVHGGPGTGKTAIVVAMLRAWMRVSGTPVALAAPTGKAADRLRASVENGLAKIGASHPIDDELAARFAGGQLSPRTLHRLLGYAPSVGRFRHHEGNPLAEQLVIVDEASMIDLFLMEQLLSAVGPAARLVLIGDADQLPSVAAGAALRDLVESCAGATVRLTESHRMDPSQPDGSNILRVARAFNAGTLPKRVRATSEGLPSEADAIAKMVAVPDELHALAGVHLFAPRGLSELDALFDRYFATYSAGGVALRATTRKTWVRDGGALVDRDGAARLFAFNDQARLLCITKSAARPTGVAAVNDAFHRRRAAELSLPLAIGRVFVGEPLLITKNDYERGLFNGDTCLALFTANAGGSPRLSAVFRKGDRFVAYPLASILPSAELGYATTVHKAQGSEHDRVTLLLPDTDSPRLMTREIVYTAVTRARRSVLIVGSDSMLARAVERRVERSTGLGERIS